eukprot:NODE_6850_length_836_cov_40.472651_g6250_i0.p1 GENE.NODE_6850_length_836_cov_40.472651_g6250_i0~~NODE_6850_length_836_cov_40.472651_g6250_i0.p1  ORF type:complete len:252 (-),score=34.08 NODE_6850_length_836_cov_40.472651_g6250_i0:45-800(-)
MSRIRELGMLRTPPYRPPSNHSNGYEIGNTFAAASANEESLYYNSLSLPPATSPNRKLFNKRPLSRQADNQLHFRSGPEVMVQNDPIASPSDPSYFYWLYGYLEFRIHDTEEEMLKKATKQIDRLVERLRSTPAKGQLLYDIIATRKHIATGVPHRLGSGIYRYVENTYWKDITTTFVGLTDNTARRVARDVFCKNTDLSKHKFDFGIVDNLHMFVIYPPNNKQQDDDVGLSRSGPAYVSVHELCKSRNIH